MSKDLQSRSTKPLAPDHGGARIVSPVPSLHSVHVKAVVNQRSPITESMKFVSVPQVDLVELIDARKLVDVECKELCSAHADSPGVIPVPELVVVESGSKGIPADVGVGAQRSCGVAIDSLYPLDALNGAMNALGPVLSDGHYEDHSAGVFSKLGVDISTPDSIVRICHKYSLGDPGGIGCEKDFLDGIPMGEALVTPQDVKNVGQMTNCSEVNALVVVADSVTNCAQIVGAVGTGCSQEHRQSEDAEDALQTMAFVAPFGISRKLPLPVLDISDPPGGCRFAGFLNVHGFLMWWCATVESSADLEKNDWCCRLLWCDWFGSLVYLPNCLKMLVWVAAPTAGMALRVEAVGNRMAQTLSLLG
ncbi:hypothetical protein Nepgr_024716 [Nepenthes gracilis]|uniref:Uncharacterized protein n=1 Tax=Nepenthes gracilis TaxID=150966 RepID=A0AAD3XZ22_NEPGR|nr:hypothetical protein Nepgr_024716 [Nepenthes gracilis]